MENIIKNFAEIPLRTIVDYLLIIMPIILSCVAIGISIATSNKQNKIAVFELRYRCYSQLRTIRSFDSSIYDCDNPKIILIMFDALWGTDLTKKSSEDSLLAARCHLEKIVHDVANEEFLFKRKFDVNVCDILINTNRIVTAATNDEVDKSAQAELHRLCEIFEKNDLPYMKKTLKL